MKIVIRSQSQLPIRRSYKPARRLRFVPSNPLACRRIATSAMADATAVSVLAAIRDDPGFVDESENA